MKTTNIARDLKLFLKGMLYERRKISKNKEK